MNDKFLNQITEFEENKEIPALKGISGNRRRNVSGMPVGNKGIIYER